MNKVIDAMLAELSPDMMDQAINVISAAEKMIKPPPLLPDKNPLRTPTVGGHRERSRSLRPRQILHAGWQLDVVRLRIRR